MKLTMFGVDAQYEIKSIKKTNKDIQWLEPVLVQWLKIHRDYVEDANFEDCLYWYNERANVSVFAGAMWKCGGIALEEYSAFKADETENAKRGRIDLYLQSHGNSAVCEAKMTWIYLCEAHKQQTNFSNAIANAIEKASNDVLKTLNANPNSLGIALNFITGYSRENVDAIESLTSLKEEIKNSTCDFYAWLEIKEKKIISGNGNSHNFIAILGTVQR
jgi:hypothetical protein